MDTAQDHGAAANGCPLRLDLTSPLPCIGSSRRRNTASPFMPHRHGRPCVGRAMTGELPRRPIDQGGRAVDVALAGALRDPTSRGVPGRIAASERANG
jgi:hypothetical protein